ncbi:hypothetical protein [Spirosoma koreense]
MSTKSQKQAPPPAIGPPIGLQVFSKDYWHGRFKQAFTEWEDLAELADTLGEHDPEYARAAGTLFLQRIQAGRAKAEVISKAVLLMEQLRPPKARKSLLSRQKINVD